MINLQFFPSRHRPLHGAAVHRAQLLDPVLARPVLMTLDLLGNSGDILAHPGNGDAELWRYVGLRVPQLIARFLPFSVLLGTLVTLVTLNQHSEIITMKAAGISAHQIIAPLILAGLFVAMINFAFNERVVTRANASFSAWEAVEYGPVPAASGVQNDVRLKHGEDLIFVRQVAGEGNAIRLAGITIYDRTGGTCARSSAPIPASRPAWLGTAQCHPLSVDTGRECAWRAPSSARRCSPTSSPRQRRCRRAGLLDAAQVDRVARRGRPSDRDARASLGTRLRARCRPC